MTKKCHLTAIRNWEHRLKQCRISQVIVSDFQISKTFPQLCLNSRHYKTSGNDIWKFPTFPDCVRTLGLLKSPWSPHTDFYVAVLKCPEPTLQCRLCCRGSEGRCTKQETSTVMTVAALAAVSPSLSVVLDARPLRQRTAWIKLSVSALGALTSLTSTPSLPAKTSWYCTPKEKRFWLKSEHTDICKQTHREKHTTRHQGQCA
jgi:hypothetical protein